MKFPTDFTVKVKCLPMSIRMLKLNNGIFEYSNIGLKIESELSLETGTSEICQHLISHLELSVQYSINTFEYMRACAVYFHCNRAKQNVFVNCFF